MGIHHIRRKQFSPSLPKLHSLYNSCMENHATNPNSNEYYITAMILDIQTDEVDESSFLRIALANQVIDALNIGNIFHHKSVKYRIPAYFKDQSVHIISYSYATPIATKILNWKSVLQDLNIYDFNYKPSDCVSVSSLFIYNSAGQVITGELNIINKYRCC